MYGVIMAGGQGSRLRPLTLTRPKPMVEILGRPVIDFVKDAMQDASIDTIVVTTGYRGEQLEDHVESWTQGEHPIHAWVNQESTPMGTAGSVRLLSEHLTETFVVGSGDSVASFDIGALLNSHRQSGARVTMALWEVDDPTEFGIVGLSHSHLGELDGELREGYICKFKEKPKSDEAFSNVINAGLYIIEPEVLALVPEGEKFDFSKQLFPMVLEKGWPMYAKTIDGVWFDVGTPFARKICAFGVRASRWVTMHGFALNVNADLGYFDHMIPCGIKGKSVTSLNVELGKKNIPIAQVKEKLIYHFLNLFDAKKSP